MRRLCLCPLVRPLVKFRRMRSFFFLREVISGAGAVHENADSSLRVHSIRKVSTSTVFMQNWSVSRVLEASSWRSNSVSASFYLRDVQYVFEGMCSLGPFVAAGAVVNPT